MGIISSSIRAIFYIIKTVCLVLTLIGVGMVITFALIGLGKVQPERADEWSLYLLVASVISFIPWLIFRWLYGGMKRYQLLSTQNDLIYQLYQEGQLKDKGLQRAKELINGA